MAPCQTLPPALLTRSLRQARLPAWTSRAFSSAAVGAQLPSSTTAMAPSGSSFQRHLQQRPTSSPPHRLRLDPETPFSYCSKVHFQIVSLNVSFNLDARVAHHTNSGITAWSFSALRPSSRKAPTQFLTSTGAIFDVRSSYSTVPAMARWGGTRTCSGTLLCLLFPPLDPKHF